MSLQTSAIAVPPPLALGLRPVNNACVDCHRTVAISDRQELAWDDENQPRRRCADCIRKREKEGSL